MKNFGLQLGVANFLMGINMEKEMNKYWNEKALMSYSQIFLLIFGMFAFSYLFSEFYTEKEVLDEGNIEEKIVENTRRSSNFLGRLPSLKEIFKVNLFGGVDAIELGQVCCEETVDGHTCEEVVPEACSSAFRSVPTSCESTEFCKLGCCISPTNGICNGGTSRRDCELSGGDYVQDPDCNVQECMKGCCTIGSETDWVTEANCIWEGNLQGQTMETYFNRDITSHTECAFLTEGDKEGACVYESEDETLCVYTSLSACIDRTGTEANFYRDTFCSNPDLNTTCIAQNHSDCINGEEDVYWFDSCNNKEDVAENCDFYRGSYCKIGGDGASCEDIRCDTNGDGTKDRAHGESWCSYDGAIGDGKDPAGSRHVKHICYRGTERLAPCSDYRNEICVQEDTPIDGDSFSQAACRTNQWRACIEYNREKSTDKLVSKCEKNVDCAIKDIDMASPDGSFKFKVCLPDYPPGLDLGSDELFDAEGNLDMEAYYQSTSGQDVCNLATMECETTWQCCLIFFVPVCWCVANCDCHTSKFPTEMNDFCTKLGDCGSYINYIGKATNEGHMLSGDKDVPGKLSDATINAMSKYADMEATPAEPGSYEFFEETLNIDGLAAAAAGGGSLDGRELSDFEKELMQAAGAYGSPLLLEILKEDEDGKDAAVGLIPSTTNLARFGSVGSIQSLLLSQTSFTDPKPGPDLSMPLAMLGFIVAQLITQSILMSALMGLLLFMIFGPCWIEKHHVDFSCMQWEAPIGGDDCNECNKLDVPCTEYRCESLGQLCHLINKGTTNELCISRPENENFPVMSPFENAISDGYSYAEVGQGGFKVVNATDPSGCIDPWTPVDIGIKVEPFAKCRIGDRPDQTYAEMSELFGPRGNSILPAHLSTLYFLRPETYQSYYEIADAQLLELDNSAINVEDYRQYFEHAPPGAWESFRDSWNGGEYQTGDYLKNFRLTEEVIREMGKKDLYVKCKTASGKINPDPYHIEACVRPGPDLTPPRISPVTLPINGAYLEYGEEEQEITIWVNEPPECRWSKTQGLDFDDMENDMTCNIIPDLSRRMFPCVTQVTELTEDTTIYIKCRDISENGNEMTEDFVFEFVSSSSPLSITDVVPRRGESITSNVEPVSVELKIKTEGGIRDGEAKCSWSGAGGDYFYYDPQTSPNGSDIHEYSVTNLGQGGYNINFICEDLAGNTAENSTNFDIKVDRFGPRVVRVYNDGGLKIVTAEEATCKYSFNRNFVFENASRMGGDGYNHNAGWITNTYYIQCEDEYGNRGSRITVKPI